MDELVPGVSPCAAAAVLWKQKGRRFQLETEDHTSLSLRQRQEREREREREREWEREGEREKGREKGRQRKKKPGERMMKRTTMLRWVDNPGLPSRVFSLCPCWIGLGSTLVESGVLPGWICDSLGKEHREEKTRVLPAVPSQERLLSRLSRDQGNVTSAWCNATNGNNCCQGGCSHTMQQNQCYAALCKQWKIFHFSCCAALLRAVWTSDYFLWSISPGCSSG